MKQKGLLSSKNQVVLISYYIGKVLHYISFAYVLLYALPNREMRGLYRGIYSAAFLLANLELNEAVIRYFPKFDKTKKPFFLGWVCLINTIIFLLVLGLIFFYRLLGLGSNSQSQVLAYGGIVLLLGYIIQLAKMLKSWAVVHRHLVVPNLLQNILIELFLLGLFYSYHLKYITFEGLLYFMLLPYTIHLILVTAYLASKGKLKIRWPSYQVIDPAFRRSFFIYSCFVILASRVMVLVFRADVFMLGWLCGDAHVAIYTDVINIVLLLEIPIKLGRQAVAPLVRSAFAQENWVELKRTYRRITQQQVLLSGVVLITFYYHLSYLLTDKTLLWGEGIFLLLALAKMIQNLFSTSHIMLVMSPFFSVTGYIIVLLAPILVVNFYCIQQFGLFGAAWGTLLSSALLGCITAFLVWWKMGLQPFSKELILLFGVILVCLVLEPFIPKITWTFRGIRLLIPLLVYGIGLAINKSNESKITGIDKD